MKLQRIVTSAIDATRDRIYVTRAEKRHLEGIDRIYADKLIEASGPSVHNIRKIAKNWQLAYKHNFERKTTIELLENQLKKPTILTRIFSRLTHK